ncbi:hypothetical protein [Helicobacter fennelliae]|uniref:Uncharacterized protein n=2 Tax=Helicobacter fennelliae TaxID=215 RepID=T1D495_9HELI|nr:hypothetical protein [Helicobacter fennelliae]GAD20026.1 hypothetical protein HFN_1270 [Helicobacter fennelliae MRY12-0050]SQB98212.1 Uncharacterised protein [Helicobacter fennelliae]STP07748.1 Uncharacterised protein [Helicobacter fennelliae]
MKISNIESRDSSAKNALQAKTQNSTTSAKTSPQIKTSQKEISKVESLSKKNDTFEPLAISVKNANLTIGSLDVMIDTIKTLQIQNKDFSKLATKFQKVATQDKAQHIIKQADVIKGEMKQTFDSAMFENENVFSKNYESLIPESKLNTNKITSPKTLDVKQIENLKQYANDLDTQKKYAKEAKKILQHKVEETLAKTTQSTDSSFEKVDLSKLNTQEFKAAQSGRGITLDRVMSLLH